MRTIRRALTGRLAAVLGVLAILANILAPAALAGAGARADAAMFAGPFNAAICHGGRIDAPAAPDNDIAPGLHCPLCPAPAATALPAQAAVPVPVAFVRYAAAPVQMAPQPCPAAPDSAHRPRAPPALS
jgi:hypothetical protein